ALDHHEADDPPPSQARRPELVGRQVRHVVGEADAADHMITGSGLRFSSLGQNQAISAMAGGIAPNTTAHGEKIDEMKNTAVATHAMNGHRLASGIASRRSGVAAPTAGSSHSLWSRRGPAPT